MLELLELIYLIDFYPCKNLKTEYLEDFLIDKLDLDYIDKLYDLCDQFKLKKLLVAINNTLVYK